MFLMSLWYLSYYFYPLIGQSCQQIRASQKSCHLIITNDFCAAVLLGVQSPSAYCALFGMVIEFWIIGCLGSMALMCVLQMVGIFSLSLLLFHISLSFVMIWGLSWAAVLDCESDFCPLRLESGAEKVAIEKKLTGKEL